MTTSGVVSYTVEADWERDTTYGHADADITGYILGMNWQWGFMEPFQQFAPPASATIVLNNSSGDWNVGNTGSAFYGLVKKGTLVRIKVNHKASDIASPTLNTFFIGKIDNLQVDYGALGRRTATLTLSDPMLALLDTPYTPKLLENVRVDEVIQSMFDEAIYPYPYASEFWILGDATYGVLGTTTTLFEERILDLDTAQTTLEFAGDQMASNIGTTAQAYLRELVAAEGLGKFFYDAPSGELRFWNRDHIVEDITDLFASALDYQYILTDPPPIYDHLSRLANDVQVNYNPRTAGTAGSTIYQMPNALRVGAGEVRTITARYADPDAPDGACGAVDVLTPVATIDYVANTAADGSGTDVTTYIVVTMNAGATSADLIISNGYHQTAYITSFQIRGTPLVGYQSETAQAVDNASILANDRWPRIVDAAMIPADTAQDLADVLVGRDASPKPYLRELTIPWIYETDGFISGIDRTHLRTIVTNDPWSDDETTRFYCVVGRRHSVPTLGVHNATYILEPIDESSTCWILEDAVFGVLGVSTKLYF